MADTPKNRPEDVPEKFWDGETGSVRVNAMSKSYSELERKLGGIEGGGVPDGPDDYQITLDGKPMETDKDVNTRLYAAGLTHKQAQTVYELAHEKMQPMLTELATNLESEAQNRRLASHFGGKEKWQTVSRQLSTWGRANLSDDVFDALSGTYEGVISIHRMMESREPGISKNATQVDGLTEKALKELMNDPRYWRDRDPATVEKVRQGFKALFPEQP
ncbi:MAG: hypothetical protein HQ504_02035 [Rhodospirillaceae bacterium]|nr:hypothetical protein [Rhodospirillaceae bacterium]